MFEPVDWAGVFVPAVPLLELFVRGTLVYLAVFVLLRLVAKRQTSGVAVTDVLVIVLIADASSNAMVEGTRSVPEGIMLVATIVFWSYTLDWASYRFPALDRLINPRPVDLVRDGVVQEPNLKRELLTLDELRSLLREQGVDNLAVVKCAKMEPFGRVSVIQTDGTPPTNPPPPPVR